MYYINHSKICVYSPLMNQQSPITEHPKCVILQGMSRVQEKGKVYILIIHFSALYILKIFLLCTVYFVYK